MVKHSSFCLCTISIGLKISSQRTIEIVNSRPQGHCTAVGVKMTELLLFALAVSRDMKTRTQRKAVKEI
jgi:hypothetical protein